MILALCLVMMNTLPDTTLDGRPVKLAPGSKEMGVTRAPPLDIAEGIDHDAPAVGVLDDGSIVVAFVSRSADDRETIVIRVSESSLGELGAPRVVSKGPRAWNPVVATMNDSAWISWCGGGKVYLRRVRPEPMGEIVLVAAGSQRQCDPAIVIASNGSVHVAWESGDRIAWRSFSPNAEPLAPATIVSDKPSGSSRTLDRRPSILAVNDRIYLAWDRLDTTVRPGALDPLYEVLLRIGAIEDNIGENEENKKMVWSEPVKVHSCHGIQAAPALAPSLDGDGVIVAYHSSDRHPLVKWWRVRKVDSKGEISQLAAADPGGEIAPEGEQQGAEFPALAQSPKGRLVLLTRPSQGAFLHIVEASGVRPPLDLTRRGWGARGARARIAFGSDGTLLAVRRARHAVVLERFTLESEGDGPPPFRPLSEDSAEAPPKNVPWQRAAQRVRMVDSQVLSPDVPKRRILMGDIHSHSALSDGTGPADEVYARARVRGMDFAALTDHDYIVGSRMFPSKHAEIVWITDWFNQLEDFSTLHAFEWTTPPLPRGYGHRNVYFRDQPAFPQPGSRDGYPDTQSLHAFLSDKKAFTAAHHTAWTGTDWANLDPEVQRHVEIVSVHGAFERDAMEDAPIEPRGDFEDGFVVNGLAQGHVFGFLGGSDSHGLLWHHGLGRRFDPWDHGLTGVVVSQNERGEIWDAIHSRLTYATSGAPMELQVSVSGLLMGREGRVDGAPEVRWAYKTTAQPRYLMIFRDGKPVHRLELDESAGSGTWRDETASSVRHVYYIRLVQGEGEAGVDIAWSSPVFVEIRK